MGKEIERKFLVNTDIWDKIEKPIGNKIVQAYILSHPEKTIRVRITKKKGFLTIKGKTEGISRSEYEYEIPLKDAEELITQFSGSVIDKIRYPMAIGKHVWEVDVFDGDNKGLIVAEIELSAEDETFEKPLWLGKEVSHEPKYFNGSLEKLPYSKW